MAEDAFPQEQDRELNQAKSDLFGGLKAIFVLYMLIFATEVLSWQPYLFSQMLCVCGYRPIVHDRRMTRDDILYAAYSVCETLPYHVKVQPSIPARNIPFNARTNIYSLIRPCTLHCWLHILQSSTLTSETAMSQSSAWSRTFLTFRAQKREMTAVADVIEKMTHMAIRPSRSLTCAKE